MGRRTVLVPVGVLAGVLALTGGIAAVVEQSAARPGPQHVLPATVAPPELRAAVEATLGHRSLQLRSSDDALGSATGVIDTATGNTSLTMHLKVPDGSTATPQPKLRVTTDLEARLIGDVLYTNAPDGPFSVDDRADSSGKPWSAGRLSPEEQLETSYVAVLRSLATGTNRWPIQRVDGPTGVSRFRLTSTATSPDGADALEIDVQNGEIVRLATRPAPAPDCPGTWDDEMRQDDAADVEAFAVTGSEDPVTVVAPPRSQVEFEDIGDEPDDPEPTDDTTECPSGAPSALPDDFPTALPSDLPSDFPTAFPTSGPSGYFGPAVQSPPAAHR